MPPKIYNKAAIEEGGFIVEFSNQGSLPKMNPNPVNYSKVKMRCRHAGCGKQTKALYGLCTKHSTHTGDRPRHTVDWIGRLIPPGYTRAQCLTDAPPHWQITETLITWMNGHPDRVKLMDVFISDLLDGSELGVVGNIPDATTLQANFATNQTGEESPNTIVDHIKELVEKHFPKTKFETVLIDAGTYRDKSINGMPIRVAVALLVTAFVCEESNRGDLWFCKKYLDETKSKYASAYMSSVYYLLRRHTKATPTQAEVSLRH